MKFKIGVVLLLVYSAAIMGCELMFGQPAVREYLTDIHGKVFFYGINTTLTTLFLVLIAYNFILCALDFKKSDRGKKLLWFFISQSALFLFLAMDERFKVHERIGVHLKIDDAYVLGMIGVFELGLLYYYKEIQWPRTFKSLSLFLGGFLFGIMILIDAFGADKGVLRLSFEDLSKTWAIFFLFLYSFESYKLSIKTA